MGSRGTVGNESPGRVTLLDYLRVLARHKLLVALVAVLVPVAALYLTLGQEPRYEASAEVLLSRQNLASALTGIPNADRDIQPELLTSTQARLARVPEVALRALAAAGREGRELQGFLANSSVSGEAGADILTFTVSDAEPGIASTLANAYAEEFTQYRHKLETASFRSAGAELEDRLSELRAAGAKKSRLYKTLVAEQRQLQTLEVLQTASATVVQRSTDAQQTRPRPLRALALSVPLGMILAVALALVAHVLDTRVWSAPEIARRLRLRLLGRIPALPRRFRPSDRLIMLHRPRSERARVFRGLRANLELANRAHGTSMIMFTSAGPHEGKSVTAANLAIALARAGRDVVLVDLNLGKPAIGNLFGVTGREGVAEVLAGRTVIESALIDVPARSDRTAGPAGFELGGRLRILPAGTMSPTLADLAGTQAMGEMLGGAQEAAELVLIEAPPLLDGGDAIALSAQVEAIVFVARARKARRAVLEEVRRLLEGSPAVKLGVVVTAADLETDDADGALAPVAHGVVEARAA